MTPDLVLPSRFRRRHRVELVGSGMGGAGAMGISLGDSRRNSGPSFPATQAGLLAWGRADSGITLSGSNVSAWADKTGHGNGMVQATETSQPLFVASSGLNSQPAVRMASSGNKFIVGTFSSQYTGSAITIISIGLLTGITSGRVLAAYTSPGTGNSFDNVGSCELEQINFTNLAAQRNSVHVNLTIPTTASGLAGVYSLWADGTNLHSRLAGTDSAGLASAGAFAINKFLIGCGLVGGNVANISAQYDVCEWAIIDHALSPTEWAAWSAYTTPRYGVAA